MRFLTRGTLILVALFFAACSGDPEIEPPVTDPVTDPKPKPKPDPDSDPEDVLSDKKEMISYEIKAELNGLPEDIIGIIDPDNSTITLSARIPEDKELIATFEAEGEVYVGEEVQESGVSAHFMSDGLAYEVFAEDGSSLVYEVLAEAYMDLKMLTSISLTIEQEGQQLKLDADIEPYTYDITFEIPNFKWVENISAVTTDFTAVGQVHVGGITQLSGTTANDFRRPVTFTVVAENGSSVEYTVALECPQTTGLPVIKIDTDGGQEIIEKKTYINAGFVLEDADNPQYNVETVTGIRGRGNTTWAYDKKPYRIKFDKKTSLFGLGKAKSWVLLANYLDPGFMTAHVAFELGHRLDVPYTNHAFHVELFLNGEYQGNYVLTEQVQVNEFRVDIDEDNDYLLELDTYFDEDYKFYSDYIRLPVNIKSPEFTSNSQVEPVREAVDGMLALLFDPEFDFPNNNYREVIDVDVLIDYILVNEIVRNVEINRPKSTYMTKKTDGKFTMGPLWDFDWAYGYSESRGMRHNYFNLPKYQMFSAYHPDFDAGQRFFTIFFEDPDFREQYKARWNAVKSSVYSIDGYIDEVAGQICRSAQYDYEVWPVNRENIDFMEFAEKMKQFMITRITYLDQKINEL